MQELIYMSERKLDAFVLPQRKRGMPKRLDVDVEVFGAKLSPRLNATTA
jgi:hypothetical protein